MLQTKYHLYALVVLRFEVSVIILSFQHKWSHKKSIQAILKSWVKIALLWRQVCPKQMPVLRTNVTMFIQEPCFDTKFQIRTWTVNISWVYQWLKDFMTKSYHCVLTSATPFALKYLPYKIYFDRYTNAISYILAKINEIT